MYSFYLKIYAIIAYIMCSQQNLNTPKKASKKPINYALPYAKQYNSCFNWLKLPILQQLIQLIPNIRFIGGAIRDSLLNNTNNFIPTDIDCATNLAPLEVKNILESLKLRPLLQGFDHGTVGFVHYYKFIENNIKKELKIEIQITTLRSDINCDGRWAQVQYNTTDSENNWYLDTQRRDLSINALAIDKNKQLYDYHQGLNHLFKGNIKFIGNINTRITEDYLRILRYIRFFGRYSKHYNIGFTTLKSLQAHGPRVLNLSAERIGQEFYKNLTQNKPELELFSLLNLDFIIFGSKFNLSFFNFCLPIVQNITKQLNISYYEILLVIIFGYNYLSFNQNKLIKNLALSKKNSHIINLALNYYKYYNSTTGYNKNFYKNGPNIYCKIIHLLNIYYNLYTNKPTDYAVTIINKLLKHNKTLNTFTLDGTTIINFFKNKGIDLQGQAIGDLLLEAKFFYYNNFNNNIKTSNSSLLQKLYEKFVDK